MTQAPRGPGPKRGVFTGGVVRGKFQPDDPVRMKQVFLARNGLRTRVEVSPVPRSRSDAQLNYYWVAVVAALVDWCGHDENFCHRYLKDNVLRPMMGRKLFLALPDGGRIEPDPSTTLLSVDEMNEYIAKCKAHLWEEHEVIVPDIDHVSLR